MPGYHLQNIPKGTLGEPSKIYEEFCEFLDAHSQKVSLMEMIELSDLLGASYFYIQKYFSIDDWNQIYQKIFEQYQSQKIIENFQFVNDFYQFYHHLDQIESFYRFFQSIQNYIQKYNFSLLDLWKMNLVTQRAFLEGERT